MKYDIITFGSATQDVFMSSRKFDVIEDDKFLTKKGLCVPLGSKINMDSVFFAMGGTGTNCAVTFTNQGFKTSYYGLVGKDVAGVGVKEELEKHGVLLDLLKETEKFPTAYSVILSLPETGRSILKKLGACHEISEKDIDLEKIKADWVYLGSLSGNSYKIFESVVNYAFENKIKIAANPVGNMQLKEGLENLKTLLGKIDVLVVNQEEASLLTGVDYKNEKEIFKKLNELANGIVIMTKGPDGLTASDGKNLYTARIPESDMVDRTGAGDAFGSGFVSGWIEKQDITYAIQLGTANATGVLQELGAVNGLLEKGDWGPWSKVEVQIIKI